MNIRSRAFFTSTKRGIGVVLSLALLSSGYSVVAAPPALATPLTPVSDQAGISRDWRVPVIDSQAGVGARLSTTPGATIELPDVPPNANGALIRISIFNAAKTTRLFAAGALALTVVPNTSASTVILVPIVAGAVGLYADQSVDTRVELLATFQGDASVPGSTIALTVPYQRADTSGDQTGGAKLDADGTSIGLVGLGEVTSTDVRSVWVTATVVAPAPGTLALGGQTVLVPAGSTSVTTIVIPDQGAMAVSYQAADGSGAAASLDVVVRGWVPEAPQNTAVVNVLDSYTPITIAHQATATVAVPQHRDVPLTVPVSADTTTALALITATPSSELSLFDIGQYSEGIGLGAVVDPIAGAVPQLVVVDVASQAAKAHSRDAAVEAKITWLGGYLGEPVGADKPQVSITSPTPGQQIDMSDSQGFTMSGVVSSNTAIESVLIQSDGETVGSAALTYSAEGVTWSFGGLAPLGSQTVTVKVIDRAGSTATADVTFTVLTPKPDDVILSPETVVLPDTVGGVDLIDGSDTTTVTFNVQPEFKPGDIIVSSPVPGAPMGLLRRVDAIDQVGDQWIAQTSTAVLTDALWYCNQDETIDALAFVVPDEQDWTSSEPTDVLDDGVNNIQVLSAEQAAMTPYENKVDIPSDWQQGVDDSAAASEPWVPLGSPLMRGAPIDPAPNDTVPSKALKVSFQFGFEVGANAKTTDLSKASDETKKGFSSKIKASMGVMLTLETQLTLSMHGTVKISPSKWAFGITVIKVQEVTAKLVETTTNKMALEAYLQSEFTESYGKSHTVVMIPMPAGPIPVAVEAKLGVDLSLSISGKVSLSASYSVMHLQTLEVTYSSGKGWKSTPGCESWYDTPLPAQHDETVTAKLSAGPSLELGFWVADIVGLTATGRIEVGITGELKIENGVESAKISADLTVTVTGNIEIQVPVIEWVIMTFQLAKFEVTIPMFVLCWQQDSGFGTCDAASQDPPPTTPTTPPDSPPTTPPEIATPGTIGTNTVWSASDGVVVVDGTLTIDAGSTLTIDPGAIVKVRNNGGFDVKGSLVINGTTDQPVIITSYQDDSVGGDTDGKPEPPNKLQISTWAIRVMDSEASLDMVGADLRYLRFIWAGNISSYSELDGPGVQHVKITDSQISGTRWGIRTSPAHQGGSGLISVTSSEGNVTIARNKISEMSPSAVADPTVLGAIYGIQLESIAGTIDVSDNQFTMDSTFSNGPLLNAMIRVYGNLNSSGHAYYHPCNNPVISNNDLTGNAQIAISVTCDAIDINQVSGNTINRPGTNGGLQLSGKISSDASLNSGPGNLVPELANVTIPAGVTLNINPGKVRLDSINVIDGTLQAVGGADGPSDSVTFEPVRDMTGAQPLPGHCTGISVQGGTLLLDETRFTGCLGYANFPNTFTAYSLIATNGARSVQITNSTFSGAQDNVIYTANNKTAPQITGNYFFPGSYWYGVGYQVIVAKSPVQLALLADNQVAADPAWNNGIFLYDDTMSANGSLPWGGNMTPIVLGLKVPDSLTLELQPGAVIKTRAPVDNFEVCGICVSGSLYSAGTKSNPVVFTAEWDDRVGGTSVRHVGSSDLRATHVAVEQWALSAKFSHTVFMNADTAIYTYDFTETHVVNSKFINNNRAVDSYQTTDRYNDMTFNEKVAAGFLPVVSKAIGVVYPLAMIADNDCHDPYISQAVYMQNNWFGESGMAGYEEHSVPDVTGEITLGNRKFSVSSLFDVASLMVNLQGPTVDDVKDAYKETHKVTADPDKELDLFVQQTNALNDALDLIDGKFNALSLWTDLWNGLVLEPGDNSIPVTKWTCKIAGSPIPRITSPVRNEAEAYQAAYGPDAELWPVLPGVNDYADMPLISNEQWLEDDPYLETSTRVGDDNSDLFSLLAQAFIQSRPTYQISLDPMFKPSTVDYQVTVPYEVTNIAFDPFPTAGSWQSPQGCSGNNCYVPLDVGSKTVEFNVTAPDKETKTTYTVGIKRDAPNSDPSLAELEFSAGVLSPAFDPAITDYTLTIAQPAGYQQLGAQVVNWAAATTDPYAMVGWITGNGSAFTINGVGGPNLNASSPQTNAWNTSGWPYNGGGSRVFGTSTVAPGASMAPLVIHSYAQDTKTERVYTINIVNA